MRTSAKPSTTGKARWLFISAKNNNEAVVVALLAKGAQADYVDSYGDTPLSIAKANGHAKVLALLEARK